MKLVAEDHITELHSTYWQAKASNDHRSIARQVERVVSLINTTARSLRDERGLEDLDERISSLQTRLLKNNWDEKHKEIINLNTSCLRVDPGSEVYHQVDPLYIARIDKVRREAEAQILPLRDSQQKQLLQELNRVHVEHLELKQVADQTRQARNHGHSLSLQSYQSSAQANAHTRSGKSYGSIQSEIFEDPRVEAKTVVSKMPLLRQQLRRNAQHILTSTPAPPPPKL